MGAVQKYCNLKPAISNRDSIDNNLPFSSNDPLSYSVDWLIYGSSGHGRFATLKYHNYSDEPFYDNPADQKAIKCGWYYPKKVPKHKLINNRNIPWGP